MQGIFARENGQGAFFNAEQPPAEGGITDIAAASGPPEIPPDKPKSPGRGNLKLVK